MKNSKVILLLAFVLAVAFAFATPKKKTYAYYFVAVYDSTYTHWTWQRVTTYPLVGFCDYQETLDCGIETDDPTPPADDTRVFGATWGEYHW